MPSHSIPKIILKGASTDSQKIEYVYELSANNGIWSSVTELDYKFIDGHVAPVKAAKLRFVHDDYVDYSLYWEDLGLNLCSYLCDLRRSTPNFRAYQMTNVPTVEYPLYPHQDDEFLQAVNLDELHTYLQRVFSMIATIEASHCYIRHRGQVLGLPANELGYPSVNYLTNEYGIERDPVSKCPIIEDYQGRYQLIRACHIEMAMVNPLLEHRFMGENTTDEERADLDIGQQQYRQRRLQRESPEYEPFDWMPKPGEPNLTWEEACCTNSPHTRTEDWHTPRIMSPFDEAAQTTSKVTYASWEEFITDINNKYYGSTTTEEAAPSSPPKLPRQNSVELPEGTSNTSNTDKELTILNTMVLSGKVFTWDNHGNIVSMNDTEPLEDIKDDQSILSLD
jgi:hypothetical protein